MNSFGHAVAAAWESREPRFVLGAMLPDLATLIGARLAPLGEARVAAGVRHHHAVDGLFHDLPSFTSWWREGTAELSSAGLRRHSARAASHVAIELLLDGELTREPEAARPFLDALGAAASAPEPDWRLPPAGRWDELVERLLAVGIPHHLREPEPVTRRVIGALARRPRLRLVETELGALGGWIARAAESAGERAPALTQELRLALAAQRPGTPGTGRGTE